MRRILVRRVCEQEAVLPGPAVHPERHQLLEEPEGVLGEDGRGVGAGPVVPGRAAQPEAGEETQQHNAGHRVDPQRAVRPEHTGQGLGRDARRAERFDEVGADLTGVAARRPAAERVPFQDGDREAGPAEAVRSGQADDTPADDEDRGGRRTHESSLRAA
ncbi:hypothetical protein AB0C98_16510 [Streptomyces sp. NPDC048558]|uniref:hypothetical protein n=1 Tax=Streptomyces sp. NPDC048558 TaxID=3155759 RepID=UPI0033F83823